LISVAVYVSCNRSASWVLCGRPDIPHCRSCPSVRPCVYTSLSLTSYTNSKTKGAEKPITICAPIL